MSETVVIFDADEFRARFPKWVAKPDAELENNFDKACLILNNTSKSIVKDLKERKSLLYLLVCHITELSERGGGVVGNLSSATQGKVSTSFGMAANQNWFNQTQCGYLFWQAMAKYRYGGLYVRYERQSCL